MEILTREIGLSNVYVIRDEKTILVDTGTYRNKAGIMFELQAMGVTPEEISLIIITHGHMDHTGNLKVFKELTGAPVLAHKNAVEFLETGKHAPYITRGKWGEMFLNIVKDFPVDITEPVTPDIVIGDEDFDLKPYGVNGKIIYAPGHIDNNIAVILESGEAFTGDTVVLCPENPEMCTGALICDDREKLGKSVERLMNEADIFYCGHGGPYTKDKFRMDPEN